MDQREIKTKRAIKNAFLMLRAQKPIEKITIRELAALAEISKATFYLHYQDIYDLSEQIGKEVLTNILNSISRPENVLEKPDVFTKGNHNGLLFSDQSDPASVLRFAGAYSPRPRRFVDPGIYLPPETGIYRQYAVQHSPLHAHQGKLLCVL